MSLTVFVRDRRKPELRVIDEGIVHRVLQMCVAVDEEVEDAVPYSAECGWLINGCRQVEDAVSCLECIAGAEALIDAIKERLKP